MKLLVIHGSMRKGNTYHLAQEVIKRLQKYDDMQITEISVSELELPFCVSCHMCFTQGEDRCPHRDVIGRISAEIESCDGLILSGVVYSLHLNAAMKNLIDHLSYYFHRPTLFDQKGLVISTTAGAAEKTVAKYLRKTMAQWGIGTIKELSCKIQTVPFSLTEKQVKKIDRIAEDFYNVVFYDKRRSPNIGTLAVHSAFRGMNSVEPGISRCDREYWEETGLLYKVYPRKIGVFKTAFGALVCKVMKRVISKNVKVSEM